MPGVESTGRFTGSETSFRSHHAIVDRRHVVHGIYSETGAGKKRAQYTSDRLNKRFAVESTDDEFFIITLGVGQLYSSAEARNTLQQHGHDGTKHPKKPPFQQPALPPDNRWWQEAELERVLMDMIALSLQEKS